jgi:hypothetical protein
MRKVAIGVLAGALIGVGAAAAVASRVVQKITVTNAALRVGTPRHPAGVRLSTTLSWQGAQQATLPSITNIDLWFPQGSQYNWNKYPTCSVATLDRSGPSGCPSASIMGRGTALGYADTTITRPTITVVNGGPNVVWFYIVLNNPARVQEPVPGYITRVHGEFAYHLSTMIPENLRVVAGLPIKFVALTVTAGRGNWLALSAPPSGIKVQATFDNRTIASNQLTVQNT